MNHLLQPITSSRIPPTRSRRLRWLLALLLVALCLPASPLALVQSVQAQTSAPQFLRDFPDLRGQIADAEVWTVGGGYLYWARCGSYLRRWPLSGGRAVTLAGSSECVHSSLAADDTGLYYYDISARRIIKRAISTPFTRQIVAATQVPNGSLLLDQNAGLIADYIYWLENGAIRTADKADFSPLNAQPEPLGANVSNLTFDGAYIVYFADGYIYSLLKICLAFGGGGICTKTPLVAATGNYLNHATLTEEVFNTRITPFWVNDDEIQGYWCLNPCRATTAYTAPTVNGSAYIPGKLAVDGQYLFWVENQCTPRSGEFGGCGINGRVMKWNLQQGILSNPFDTPQQIACRDCGASYNIGNDGRNIAIANGWVYFDTSNGISRIRADAPPISWDLSLNAMEVTQGVQGLGNDVPLVADKPTYVRLFGNKLSGPNVRSVDAVLHGKAANGAALPGSPLRPVNGVQDFSANNLAVNRGDPNGGWIFQLPPEWARAGTIRLSPQVDPGGVWNDPNRANNSLPDASFSFIHKAPICIVFIPVRTNPRVQMFTSAHWFAINMTKRLLPTPDVWVYHQDEDVAELEARFGIPPWKYGPYEIGEGGSLGNGILSDSSKVISSLWTRDQFSDDPDRCDDARARTHYVGVVHADAGGNNGSGRLGGDQLWFRLPPDDTSADWMTDRAVTLAHELGHNYGRRHVDCPAGNPEDTGSFPYPTCDIDFDNAANRHYGLTYRLFGSRFETIAPQSAGDLMSYAHQLSPQKPRWISDFSWRGILNEIPNGAGAQARAAEPAVAPAAAELAQAASLVLISGAVNIGAPANSALEHAWVLPSAALSQRMIEKWQRTAAARYASSQADVQQAGSYHLRLRDASGALLDDRAITLERFADDGGAIQNFQLSFPAPATQVARIELLDGETVLASLNPGASPPAIEVVTPAGGETFDDEMTLSWRAADADSGDQLLYTVQYSPDSGQTWRALLTGFPNLGSSDTVTMPLKSLSALPASTSGGLIRVLASDGYNTSVAVSKPFTLPDRGPQPTITAPWPGQSIPAGQIVTLQGAALDAEDGSLSGEALRWTLDGKDVGAGQERAVGGLAPGQHTVTLTARDAGGRERSVTTTLTIEALRIPQGSVPTLDGDCADSAYAEASQVQLAPYANGARATVQLLRSEGHLWACFTNLARAAATSPESLAVLRVDRDNSRDTVPQPGDYVFVLGEAGVPETYSKSGDAGSIVASSLNGRVSANDATWQAELRIDAAMLGGWNRLVGLDVEHVLYDRVYTWPYAASYADPSTWATTALGEPPRLDALMPASATAGGGGFTLTVTGTGFQSDTVLRWNGADKPTAVITATQLQATIDAADIASGGTRAVSVVGPGGIESNALPFFISPAPQAAPETGDYVVLLPVVQRGAR